MIFYLIPDNEDYLMHDPRPGNKDYLMHDPIIKELVDTLKFYGNKDTYNTDGHPQIDADVTPIRKDKGKKAQDVIKKYNDHVCSVCDIDKK